MSSMLDELPMAGRLGRDGRVLPSAREAGGGDGGMERVARLGLPGGRRTRSPRPERLNVGFAELRARCRRLRFEPHDIASFLDARGRYEVPLEAEFPLHIKLFRYTSRRHTRGATWHERLELFLPLDGAARFRMGDQEVALNGGDLLIVDNLKPHHVVDFPGFDTRVIVVSFLPGFVYSLGSPSHDYAFLLPFYAPRGGAHRVLRATDPGTVEVYRALARLLDCYFVSAGHRFYQAGCKAFLLELLYRVTCAFGVGSTLEWEAARHQEHLVRLKPLFEQIQAHPEERVRVAQAAAWVRMSPAQFMKVFKRVSGMTLVAYANHARLAKAVPLLRGTDRSIADIAAEVGFADQSYFDRRFKLAFGMSPKAFRRGRAAAASGVDTPPGPSRSGMPAALPGVPALPRDAFG